MNIDLHIVTRALQKAGQEPLTKEDIDKNSTRWRTVKAFYLATILETLSRTSWTSQKVRRRLETKNRKISGFDLSFSLPQDMMEAVRLASGMPYTIIDRTLYTDDSDPELIYEGVDGEQHTEDLLRFKDNYTKYECCYALPDDCAKPEELLNNEEFIVEGTLLYTDASDAVLMYISNRNIAQHVNVEQNGDVYLEIDEECNLWWVGEDPCPYELEGDKLYYEAKDFYKDYGELNFDPLLQRFLETRLAADIALKITGDRGIYEALYNESLLIEKEAENGTKAQSQSRKNGSEWWTDRMLGYGGSDAHY